MNGIPRKQPGVTGHASPLQILIARTVHRQATLLLGLPSDRALHVTFAHRLRDMCGTALSAFHEKPVVDDDLEVGFEDVGIPFEARLVDLEQLTGELGDTLRDVTPPSAYLADDIAWISHLAHVHLVRSELSLAA